MARRLHRPLTLNTGAPTHESMTRRQQSRRTHRQLSGATREPPPPLPGNITRTVVPEIVADYEGVSTASWTTRSCTTVSGAFNCFTYHLTTTNQRTTSASVIMDPIRWTIHEPDTAGDTYDSCGQHDVFSVVDSIFTNKRGHYHYATGSESKYPLVKFVDGVGMINTLLPVSGNGHVVFYSDSFAGLKGSLASPGIYGIPPFIMDGQYQYFNQVTAVVVPELHAIASTTQWARNRYIKPRYGRHRVNGVAVGALHEWPFSGTPDPRLVTFTAGDTYEFDIWYEISIVASLSSFAMPGKHAVWIPTTKVSNGSRLPPSGFGTGAYAGDRTPRFIDFTGCNFNPDFDPSLHTYEFALGGAIHQWRFPNGTNTQKAATLPSYGWTATITRAAIRWTGPVDVGGTPGTVTLHMQWDVESVNLRLTLVYGGNDEDLYFRPEDSGDYIQTTTSNDFGAMSWASRGVFNGDGTTLFYPAASVLSDARRTPGIASFGAEVPDSITMTRVSK